MQRGRGLRILRHTSEHFPDHDLRVLMKRLAYHVVLFTIGSWLIVLSQGSTALAQRLPAESVRWTIEDACRAPHALRPLYLLQWETHLQPISPSEMRRQSTVVRAAYQFVEQHLTPYSDPATRSTWTGEKPYAVLQPALRIHIASDRLFRKWEAQDYALNLNWDNPPTLRTVTVDAFRPRLQTDSLQLLYGQPPYRKQLVDYLLPLDTILTSNERDRRLQCVSEVFGIIDDARRSDRAHSPPHLSLLFNQSLNRAIASFGWGRRGGTWVAYRRAESGWTEIRPIGRWAF